MSVARFGAIAAVAIIVTGCERKVDTLAQSEQANATASIVQPFKDRRVTNPFPDAIEVRLFVEVDYTNDNKPILSKRNGVRLNAAQRKAFEDSLKMIAAPEYEAACFLPHHYFRYYDASGKEIGEVAVCFCCYGVGASGSKALDPPDGAMLSADYGKVKALVAALGEPTDVLCD